LPPAALPPPAKAVLPAEPLAAEPPAPLPAWLVEPDPPPDATDAPPTPCPPDPAPSALLPLQPGTLASVLATNKNGAAW